MIRTATFKFLAAAFATLAFAQPSAASDPNRYGLMAQSAWSAFQCSVLAEKAQHMSEQKRLFDFGYAQGRKFIAALQSGTTKPEDVADAAPFSMLILVQGPSADFALGRIFEAALRAALEDVFASAEAYDSTAMQESIATREFMKRNCRLIGR
ncbi:MAG: hypothetical protein LJE90_00185 [Betaproteobacteria bacterium]|jgi:hypothetical protein|nr:hypothetical protein [Betaproteobacteria bacterium]